MPSPTEQLRNFGLRVKQEILPNSAEEALDRAQIASLVGYTSGAIGIIAEVGVQKLPELSTELSNISGLCFIPGVGGVVYMIAMLAREGRLRKEE